MSVIVLELDRIDRIMHLAGHLTAAGLATVPDAPADWSPDHYISRATPGGKVGWALAVARVASMAASAMTYGDPIVLDGGRPSWDPDKLDKALDNDAGCLAVMTLGDMAVDLYGLLGSVSYNTMSNGGADFMPAPAALILDGLRSSLPVRKNGLYGMIPDYDRLPRTGGGMVPATGDRWALADLS